MASKRSKIAVYEELIRDWCRHVQGINDPDRLREMAERFIAMLIAGLSVGGARAILGTTNPHLVLFANTSAELVTLKNAIEVMWPHIRVELFDEQSGREAKPFCTYCGARVRVPCSESRSNSCPNRSRGNR